MSDTLKLFPPNLQDDKLIQAFSEAMDIVFDTLGGLVPLNQIYSRINQINEPEVLDLLAWQFHIEGYELAQSLEEKRNLIKSAIELHRYKGTKYAIKKVLEALGLEGQVKEWFEYGGEPYRFMVEIDLLDTGLSEETLNKLENLINQYKNERSWLEKLIAYLTTKNKTPSVGIATFTGELTTIYPYSITELSQNTQTPHIAVGIYSGEITTIYPGGYKWLSNFIQFLQISEKQK